MGEYTKAIADDLRSWQLEYFDDLVQFRARVLRQETILGGGSSKATYKEEDADWSRVFRKWNCFSATECTDWAVVYTTRDEAAVKEFVREMKKNAPSLGLALAAPSHVVLGDSRPVTYVQRLDMVLDAKPKPQIVMVVIPNDKVSFADIIQGGPLCWPHQNLAKSMIPLIILSVG